MSTTDKKTNIEYLTFEGGGGKGIVYLGAIQALEKAIEMGADSQGRIHIALMEANIYIGSLRTAYSHAEKAKKFRNVARNARAWAPYIKEKAKNRGIKL